MGRFGDNRRGGFGGRSGGRDRGGRSGGRGGFGGRDRGGFGDRGRSRGGQGGGEFGRKRFEMHDAICDKCGKECRVPFKPTAGKPVLCSDCFREKGGGQGRQFSQRSQGMPSQSGASSEQLRQINEKLDKIIQALESCAEDEDEEEYEDDSE